MNQTEEVLPPTHHVLRPHHVFLLTVFLVAFKEFESKDLPQPFVLHIYRFLLNEVSEVAKPKSYSSLVEELHSGPKADMGYSLDLLNAISNSHIKLQTTDEMTSFFHSIQSLFTERHDDDDPPVLMRRSIFGYFCRRCYLSFIKLSFSGVIKLQKDYQQWCSGNPEAGYEPVVKDQLSNGGTLMFKTQADRKIWAQPDVFKVWEDAVSAGDENVAVENLRRFFEQRFHEKNDSGLRQHALLNLIRMHYVRGEYTAVRKLLPEAINVARTSDDKFTLQHCISLSHRLPPTEPGRRPTLNEIQPDLSPLEVLFDVQKLMQVRNEQPLSASFEKVMQAIGLYDHWAETQPSTSAEMEQWSQHSVQSIVWSAAGCDRLAEIEETVVVTFTEVGGDNNNRLTAILNRAYKLARQGQYDDSLAMLLEPDVWRGIPLNDYLLWANEIWHILVLRASRRGQFRLYRESLLPKRPAGSFSPKRYFFEGTSTETDVIHDSIFKVMKMRQCDQATSAIEPLLKALWLSEFQGRLNSYRTAIILLADVGLEFGMTKRSRRILEEIMPQVVNGNDLEQRAFACLTLARCIIVAENWSRESLCEVLPHLLKAEEDFRVLQMLRQVMDVQYYLAVVYENLGMEGEREIMVKKHFATEEERNKLEVQVVDSQVAMIWQVVADVGAALATN